MKASAMALRFMALGLMAVLLIVVPGVGYAQGEIPDCDNQWLIDTCKWGCNATEGVCGFACGAAEDTCKWGCNAGESICDELKFITNGLSGVTAPACMCLRQRHTQSRGAPSVALQPHLQVSISHWLSQSGILALSVSDPWDD